MRPGLLLLSLSFGWTSLIATSLAVRATETSSTLSGPRVAILQSGSKESAGRAYSVSIFSAPTAANETPEALLRNIDLGFHKHPPHLLDGADLDVYAVATMTPDRERIIIALNPRTGVERYRLSGGRVRYGDGDGLPWHQISGSRLLLMTYTSSGPKNLRGWSLQAFDRSTGKPIYSLHLGRKDIFRVHSQGNSLLIEQRSKSGGGKYDYRVVDAITGKLKLFQSESYRNKSRVILSLDGEHFYRISRSKVSGMAKKSGARGQEPVAGWLSTLAVYQVSSGEMRESYELGYSMSQVIASRENGLLYAAAQQSLVSGGVVVWEIGGEKVRVARQSSTDCAPTGLYVNRQSDTATVFCDQEFEHGALGKDAVVRTGKSTVVPLHFTASADEQTLYVESARQSCVLKLMLADMEASRCKKTGSTANRMLAAMGGYSSPLNFTHRSLLLNEKAARLYVLNKMAGDITLFDTERFDKLGTIDLDGYANSLVPIKKPVAGEPPMVLGIAENSLVLLDARAGKNTNAANVESPLEPLWRSPKDTRFLALTSENSLVWYAGKNTLTVVNLHDQTTVFEQTNFEGALAGRVLR